jgi:hypothetical protein
MVGSGHNGSYWGVVDQMRSGKGLRDGGVSINDSSLTLDDGSVGSSMLSTGSKDLRGLSNGLGGNSGEDGGNKGLGVEGRGNQGLSLEGGGNGKTRILNTESESISDVSDSLKDSVSVNIRVSSGDTTISVSNLLLHRVDVLVSVVEVSELILGVELASWGVVGCGGVSVMSGVPNSGVSVTGVQGA